MIISLDELKAELAADPVGLGLTGDDVADDAALNAPTRTIYVEATEAQVFGHGDRSGYWGRIERIADMGEAQIQAEYFPGGGVPVPAGQEVAYARSAKQAALSARARRLDGRNQTIDVRAPAFGQMCGLFVLMGVMTQAWADALLGMGTRPGSRAEELWGSSAHTTPSMLADARRLP
jgi:hypothetical protein